MRRRAPDPAATAAERADDAVRRVLQTQWDGLPAVRIDSPPGAGKTGIVVRLAAQAVALAGERCMLVTLTNAQACDLGRRLASRFRRLRVTMLLRESLKVPPDLLELPNVEVVHGTDALPEGPCVVVGNAAKWSWAGDDVPPFDLQVVDEAFQLPDHLFQQIANLARRVVLIGDPGQIDPVIRCPIERWRSDPTGPQVPCPRALLVRHPEVPIVRLPFSRRLVADTVRFVQPAFYPDLPFEALGDEGRGVRVSEGAGSALDPIVDRLGRGQSVVMAELPARVTGETDEKLADAIVGLIDRLFARRAAVVDYDGERPLTPEMIGVVCAHVSQVTAVQERLSSHLAGVYVETGDRFQGLERKIILVHHPLSGRADVSAFQLDAGRLCVMLSRHRVACVVFSRAGLVETLDRYVPSGERVLGLEADTEFDGWRAHRRLAGRLRRAGRVVAVG